MTDRVSKSVRSLIMSKVKSKNTKCELALCDALKEAGLTNFKKHYKVLGKPDIAFPEKKLAVFCDSDFWHGKKNVPETNREYWEKKFERNKKRDRKVNVELKKSGWKILRISEKSVLEKPLYHANRIKKFLRK